MSIKNVRVRIRRNIEYILLTVILIFAFGARLYKINNPIADWHSFRQADTASVTRTYVEKGINILIPRYHDVSSTQSGIYNPNGYRFVEFPIYNVLNALLAKNFPVLSLEVWGRLLSIFFSLATTVLLFLIGKQTGRVAIGLLAALFYALIPYNIYFTRAILPEPLAVFLGVFGIWLFLKYYRESLDRYFYLSALLFGLAMLIKPFVGFYLFPIFYLLVKKSEGIKNIILDRRIVLKLFFYFAIIIVPFLLWRVWMSRYPAGIPFFTWVFNGDDIRFRLAFWRWIFGERLGYLILGVWGIFPFIFGLVNKRINRFVLFFNLGMLFYVVVVATANVRHDYYQTYIIPAVCLTLANGLYYFWNSQELYGFLRKTISVFSVLMIFLVGGYQVKEFYKINHPEIIEVGKMVDELTPKDALVIATYNGDTAFLYQTKRWGWPVVDTSFDELIKRGAGYFATVNLNDPDTEYVEDNFEVIKKGSNYLIADLHKPKKK